MISDDVSALAAISFGAVLSTAATALLLRMDATPLPSREVRVEVVEVVRVAPPRPVVDFAIIRSPAKFEIMVGPEGPYTGWVPGEKLEIRRGRERAATSQFGRAN